MPHLPSTPHLTMFTVCFGGSFLGTAFFLLIFAAINIIRALQAQNWPTAPGVVISSYMGSSRSSDSGTSYRAVVQYQYQVADRAYTGDRLAFGSRNMYGGYGGAQRTLQRYPAGTQLQVRYDPNKPQNSVLEARSSLSGL